MSKPVAAGPRLKRADQIKSLVMQGERVTLRPPMRDDAPRIAEALSDFGVASNLSRVPYPYELQHAHQWLDMIDGEGLDRSDYPFAIVTGEGLIGVVGISSRDGGVELGYWLRRSAWGQGYATEAARLALGFAFDELDLSEVDAGHFADNTASGRVLQKLGFAYTTDEPRFSLARGGDVTCRMMILPRARYAEGRTLEGASYGG